MKKLEVNERNGLKIKPNLKLSTMIFVLTLIFAIGSFAQTGMNNKRSGGWGMGNQYDRMYDTKTVETIVGEVISVDKITPIKGMSNGVHLKVKTNKETISVHLGPEWYIEKQDIEIISKNNVEIKGSRVTYEGKPAIIAAEIIKGNEMLLLRSENGSPVWNGWRRR